MLCFIRDAHRRYHQSEAEGICYPSVLCTKHSFILIQYFYAFVLEIPLRSDHIVYCRLGVSIFGKTQYILDLKWRIHVGFLLKASQIFFFYNFYCQEKQLLETFDLSFSMAKKLDDSLTELYPLCGHVQLHIIWCLGTWTDFWKCWVDKLTKKLLWKLCFNVEMWLIFLHCGIPFFSSELQNIFNCMWKVVLSNQNL